MNRFLTKTLTGIISPVSVIFLLLFGIQPIQAQRLSIPYLDQPVNIDGDLSEWKAYSFHDGPWDIFRLEKSAWYNPKRNRLTDHGNESDPSKDLTARYYMAWDSTYLYLGAEVIDNVNDVTPHKPEPYRWYYKDCVAWFIEAPGDTINESFGQGDNGFCFVVDPKKPFNGAWWRHGSPDSNFIEEPIPSASLDYEIKMGKGRKRKANFVLEARIEMANTLGKSDPNWKKPSIGDIYRMIIVHCDPDGGDYGGHFLIYGKGDEDNTWMEVELTEAKEVVLRKKR